MDYDLRPMTKSATDLAVDISSFIKEHAFSKTDNNTFGTTLTLTDDFYCGRTYIGVLVEIKRTYSEDNTVYKYYGRMYKEEELKAFELFMSGVFSVSTINKTDKLTFCSKCGKVTEVENGHYCISCTIRNEITDNAHFKFEKLCSINKYVVGYGIYVYKLIEKTKYKSVDGGYDINLTPELIGNDYKLFKTLKEAKSSISNFQNISDTKTASGNSIGFYLNGEEDEYIAMDIIKDDNRWYVQSVNNNDHGLVANNFFIKCKNKKTLLSYIKETLNTFYINM